MQEISEVVFNSHVRDGGTCSFQDRGSNENTSQMTPQKTMWHLYSKSQPEEEASVLQIQGMKDFLFEKVYIIL